MSITFSCDTCQSPFTVDSQLAGRQARCRKCGRKMQIPAASTGGGGRPLVEWGGNGSRAGARSAAPQGSQAGDSRRGRGGTGSAVAEASAANGRPISWMDAVNSQVGLKPITMVAAPSLRQRQEVQEKSVTSYKVTVPRELRPKNRAVTKSKHLVNAGYMEGIRSYKQFFNKFAYLFRRINEMSYGFTVVCLIVAIVGAIMGKHSLTVMSISAIVLLNIVGLAAGVSNLIAIQFRGNVVKGLLFLIPPVTVYYLWTNSTKWKKPIRRVMTPIVTLAIVMAAYAYIPWLNGNKASQANWKERIEGAVDTIKHDVGGSMSEVGEKARELKGKLPDDLKNMNLDDVKKKAEETVDDLKDKFQKSTGTGGTPDKKDP
ncbi:MAG: hypothetical protein EXS05_02190 [Planctomycetaceae bacterium]|nr:hypothetical protein [Planctomycetaceae bacterium]